MGDNYEVFYAVCFGLILNRCRKFQALSGHFGCKKGGNRVRAVCLTSASQYDPLLCIAGVFPLERAHLLTSSWSHDI